MRCGPVRCGRVGVDNANAAQLGSTLGRAPVVSTPQLVGEEQMTDKKSKIDIKTRLGRASKGTTSAGLPPSGVGIAPPPSIVSGGIPAPPFAAQPRKPVGPTIDKDEPFAAVSAGEIAPQPKDIKIEIGHEVVEAQKKGVLKIVLAAAITGVLCAGAGWLIGSMQEARAQGLVVVKDAQSLISPIEQAKEQIEALQIKVDSAKKSIKDKSYPETFAKDIKDIDIDFDARRIEGKALHQLDRKYLSGLFEFTREVQDLNQRKDAIAKLFENRKVAIGEMLEQEEKPQVGYAVFVQRDKKGNAVGTFFQLSKPFKFEDEKWPDEFDFSTGSEVAKGTRYKSGEPFTQAARREGEKPTIYSIPLEPSGVAKAFPNALAQRIESELNAILTLINGTEDGQTNAELEKRGLLKLADEVTEGLRRLGTQI